MLKFLVLILVFSCSSFKSKKNQNFADERISKYVSRWKKENSQIKDREYKKQYEKYLASVEKVFLKEGMAKNIDFYLDSLKLVDNSVEKGSENYSSLYPATTADTKKTRIITQLYDDLLGERSDKLLDYYGFNFYAELMKNRKNFIEKGNENFNFPL